MSRGRDSKAFVLPATIGVAATCALIAFGGFDSAASRELCDAPTYEPDGRRWDELPAANIAQSSDDCVGFCFNAVVDREESENLARVVILEDEDVLTRGIVERTKVWGKSDLEAEEGAPVRFACFTRLDDGGAAPRFEDCAQMTASRRNAPGCEPELEMVSDAARVEPSDSFELW